MVKLNLKGNTTVAELKKAFNEAFGSQIKVYNGGIEAGETTCLSKLGLKEYGELECRSSLTAGKFIERMAERGLKVAVWTRDYHVKVLDGLTLESTGKVKNMARKSDMEDMIAYQRKDDMTEASADGKPATKNKNMNNSNLIQLVCDDIHAFMENNKKLFFNERDFQMHLALWLKNSANKYESVDLEYYIPFETLDKEYKEKWKSELRLDIVVKKEGKFLPVELKYKTKSVQKKLRRFDEDMQFVLKNQGAQDLGMYGFWKDIKRIELVRNRFENVIGGLAVFLTNDKAYMNNPKKTSNNYLLSISNGVHSKQKHWLKPETTCAKKYPNFEVDEKYEINWHCAKLEGVGLNYCIVPIN